MSAVPSMSQAEQAAGYERYVSEHWDTMSPFEQEQARAYFQAKYQPVQPQPQAQQPFAMAMQPQAGYGYGYGQPSYSGGFAPAKREQGGGWAVPVGYIGLLLFTPLAFFCGIFNLTKGRTGHGIAQVVLSATFFTIGMMALMA
jgi:hypothetical protein